MSLWDDFLSVFLAWQKSPSVSISVPLPSFYTNPTKEKPHNMMISILRTHTTEDGIFGLLTMSGDPFKCVTLENRAKAIPIGAYKVRWMWSERFKQIMPEMVVPDRTAIELHPANWPRELEGCVALGMSTDIPGNCINDSKAAWVEFIKRILNEPNIMVQVVEDYGTANA